LKKIIKLLRHTKLITDILSWQSSGNRIRTGGYTALAGTGVLAGGSAGTWVTYISNVVSDGILQDGIIRYAIARILQTGDTNQRIKFKVFRYNGSTYDMISQTEQFTIPGTGNITFTPAIPMTCKVGDIVGFAITGGSSSANRVRVAYDLFGSMRTPSVQGDITTFDAFATVTGVTINVQFYSNSPYLAVTGDSIIEGHNVGVSSLYHSIYHGGPSGTITSEVMHELSLLIGSGTILQYQNLSYGGQTFDWIASTGVPACILTKAKVVLIHGGINDISTARPWEDSLANLNTIVGLVNSASPKPRLLIDEILPWNAGNDSLAGVVRTFNKNLANFCGDNGIRLIRSHDLMGQLRTSTGHLDDMLNAYNYDDVHLSQLGVDALGSIHKNYL
jgi:hypothetical protein